MSLFEILNHDFVDDLPEDPRLAFSKIVQEVNAYLARKRSEVDETESASWYVYETAEHSAMNVIIASAKRLGIAPFDTLEVPIRTRFATNDFAQFKTDLDHYLVQMLLDNSIRSRIDRIEASETHRDAVRKYLNAIKTHIEQADMTDGKRAKLMDKLAEFEAELQKSRLPVFAIARVLMELLSLSCNVLALSDSQTFQRLVSQAFYAVAVAKSVDDERRQLPPTEPPAMLMPPRRPDYGKGCPMLAHIEHVQFS
jgi:hypothetical protein